MPDGVLVPRIPWTRGDVIELITLLCGVPAAIVAILAMMVIAKEWRRNRYGELSRFINFLLPASDSAIGGKHISPGIFSALPS